MKTYLNMVVWKPKCGHALDVVGKLEQDDQSQNENPWLWYNLSQESHMSDENQDPRIHTGVLAGTMIIIQVRTLFRNIGFEWARDACAVHSDTCHLCRLQCSFRWIACSELASCSNLDSTGTAGTRTKTCMT